MDILTIIKVFVMAVFQGIGEFLPISSSGHLLVLGKCFFANSGGIDENELMTLNILLHAGTLIAILFVFRRWIWQMFTENRRLFFLLILASIPTGIMGVIIKKRFDFLLDNLCVTGIGFLVTGVLLMKFLGNSRGSARGTDLSPFTDMPRFSESSRISAGDKTLKTMTWLDALIIGIFQGIAVLPGISRSGSTIAAGVMRKIRSEDAAVFSFLLAVPAIGGATLLEALDFVKENPGSIIDSKFTLYLFGAAVSLAVGLISLHYMMIWLKQRKLVWFAWWLFAIGFVTVLWGICS